MGAILRSHCAPTYTALMETPRRLGRRLYDVGTTDPVPLTVTEKSTRSQLGIALAHTLSRGSMGENKSDQVAQTGSTGAGR